MDRRTSEVKSGVRRRGEMRRCGGVSERIFIHLVSYVVSLFRRDQKTQNGNHYHAGQPGGTI